jgi:hypothetical protein
MAWVEGFSTVQKGCAVADAASESRRRAGFMEDIVIDGAIGYGKEEGLGAAEFVEGWRGAGERPA